MELVVTALQDRIVAVENYISQCSEVALSSKEGSSGIFGGLE